MSWSAINTVLEEEEGRGFWLPGWSLIGNCLGIGLPVGGGGWLPLLCLVVVWVFGFLFSLHLLQCLYLRPQVLLLLFFLFSSLSQWREGSKPVAVWVLGWWLESAQHGRARVRLRKAQTWGFEWKLSSFEKRTAVSAQHLRSHHGGTCDRSDGGDPQTSGWKCAYRRTGACQRGKAQSGGREVSCCFCCGAGWAVHTLGQHKNSWCHPDSLHVCLGPVSFCHTNSIQFVSPCTALGSCGQAFPFVFSGDLLVSILLTSQSHCENGGWEFWELLFTQLFQRRRCILALLCAGTFPSKWATCL